MILRDRRGCRRPRPPLQGHGRCCDTIVVNSGEGGRISAPEEGPTERAQGGGRCGNRRESENQSVETTNSCMEKLHRAAVLTLYGREFE